MFPENVDYKVIFVIAFKARAMPACKKAAYSLIWQSSLQLVGAYIYSMHHGSWLCFHILSNVGSRLSKIVSKMIG